MAKQPTKHFFENYILDAPYSSGKGVCCYPATDKDSGERYIAKVHSFPSNQKLTDALLLSGAFENLEQIDTYYRDSARELCRQAAILNALSYSEYFSHILACNTVSRDDFGYDVWFLSPYKLSLGAIFKKKELTHADTLELGINLCHAALECRQMELIHIGIKPQNIYLSNNGSFQIGDIGFAALSTLPYAPLPSNYHTAYFPPECCDCFAKIPYNADVYSIGVVLYQALNHGILPDKLSKPSFSISKDLTNIITSACSPIPDNRFHDPNEMLSALLECRSSQGSAK